MLDADSKGSSDLLSSAVRSLIFELYSLETFFIFIFLDWVCVYNFLFQSINYKLATSRSCYDLFQWAEERRLAASAAASYISFQYKGSMCTLGLLSLAACVKKKFRKPIAVTHIWFSRGASLESCWSFSPTLSMILSAERLTSLNLHCIVNTKIPVRRAVVMWWWIIGKAVTHLQEEAFFLHIVFLHFFKAWQLYVLWRNTAYKMKTWLC